MGIMIKNQVLQITNKQKLMLPKVKVVMTIITKEILMEIKSQVVHPKITNKARVVKVVMEVTVKEVFREIQVDYLKTTKVVKVSIPG